MCSHSGKCSLLPAIHEEGVTDACRGSGTKEVPSACSADLEFSHLQHYIVGPPNCLMYFD